MMWFLDHLNRYRASMSCMLQSEVEYTLMGCKVINVFHAPVMKDSFPQAGNIRRMDVIQLTLRHFQSCIIFCG